MLAPPSIDRNDTAERLSYFRFLPIAGWRRLCSTCPRAGTPDGGASLVTMTGEEEEKVVSDPIALEASTERIPVTYTHISVVKRVTQPCLPARR